MLVRAVVYICIPYCIHVMYLPIFLQHLCQFPFPKYIYLLLYIYPTIPGHFHFLCKNYVHPYIIKFIGIFFSISPQMSIHLVSYYLPPKSIFILSIFTVFDLVDCWAPITSLISLVSTNLQYLVFTAPRSSLPITSFSDYSYYCVFSFMTMSSSPVPC